MHGSALASRIEFILADFPSFARSLTASPSSRSGIDVVFLSPPWGGIEYQILGQPSPAVADTPIAAADEVEASPIYPLSALKPLHGSELFSLARGLTVNGNVGFYLPRNVNLEEVALLAREEKLEIEEEWMGGKLKAVMAIWGEDYVGKGAEMD